MLDYELPQNTSPSYKYFIYALDYYRRLLKYEMDGGSKSGRKEPVRPDILLGLESLVEFKTTDQSQQRNNQSHSYNNHQNQPQGFFDEVGKFFSDAGDTITDVYKKVENKVIEAKVDEGIAQFGQDTKNAFEQFGKDAGNFFNNVYQNFILLAISRRKKTREERT